MLWRTRQKSRRAMGRAAVRGIDAHGEDFVGFLLKATPACAVATYVHFVLGLSASGTAMGAAVGCAGITAVLKAID